MKKGAHERLPSWHLVGSASNPSIGRTTFGEAAYAGSKVGRVLIILNQFYLIKKETSKTGVGGSYRRLPIGKITRICPPTSLGALTAS
jgi:hypothetical protein